MDNSYEIENAEQQTTNKQPQYPNQHPNRTTTTVPQKPVPNIEWNNNDAKAYTDIGLQPPSHLGMFERRFLSQVDISKAPIQRTVTVMVRCKAPDYLALKDDSQNQKKPDRKEYLIYREHWEGVDWKGIPVNPVAPWSGYYTKRFTRPHVNQQTGEVDFLELDPGRMQKIHYIPFSKKKVDELIANSAKSDKETIKYTIKFDSEDSPIGATAPSRNQFTYDQFVWDWDKVYKFHTQPRVEAWVEYYNKKGLGNNTSLQFEPQ